jgi:hypothetical protein
VRKNTVTNRRFNKPRLRLIYGTATLNSRRI